MKIVTGVFLILLLSIESFAEIREGKENYIHSKTMLEFTSPDYAVGSSYALIDSSQVKRFYSKFDRGIGNLIERVGVFSLYIEDADGKEILLSQSLESTEETREKTVAHYNTMLGIAKKAGKKIIVDREPFGFYDEFGVGIVFATHEEAKEVIESSGYTSSYY